MREIKFRAMPRDIANEQLPDVFPKSELSFAYGTGIYKDNVNTWLILENNERKPFSQIKKYPIVENTLGQYTGVKGINGEEIFEGDILNFVVYDYNGDDNIHTGVVKWGFAKFVIWCSEEYVFDLDWVFAQDDELDIIGNIYENPELLI